MRAGSPTRVLLTGDESTGTLAAVRGLHAGGYEVWLAVSRPDTYAARSRRPAGVVNVSDPGEDLGRHAAEVAAAATRLGVAAVLPGTEGSLRALAGRSELFGPGIELGAPTAETLVRATGKRQLGDLARAAGLDPMPSFDLSDPEARSLSFPVVLKPPRSVVDAGSGLSVAEARVVSGPDQLGGELHQGDEPGWSIQPLVEGTLAAICGVAWEGDLVCAVHQRSPRIWPPALGNSSYATTIARDPKREAGVAAMVRAIGWSGVFGVQFILAGESAYVIDFNPRVYGSLGLAIAAGQNLPAIWVDLLLGRAVTPGEYRTGVHYRVEEDDFRALIHTFRTGRQAEALAGFLPRPRTTHAVFSITDPGPVVATIAKLRRRALSQPSWTER